MGTKLQRTCITRHKKGIQYKYTFSFTRFRIYRFSSDKTHPLRARIFLCDSSPPSLLLYIHKHHQEQFSSHRENWLSKKRGEENKNSNCNKRKLYANGQRFLSRPSPRSICSNLVHSPLSLLLFFLFLFQPIFVHQRDRR